MAACQCLLAIRIVVKQTAIRRLSIQFLPESYEELKVMLSLICFHLWWDRSRFPYYPPLPSAQLFSLKSNDAFPTSVPPLFHFLPSLNKYLWNSVLANPLNSCVPDPEQGLELWYWAQPRLHPVADVHSNVRMEGGLETWSSEHRWKLKQREFK